MKEAIFSGGCFWGFQKKFEDLRSKGIISTTVGYSNGSKKNPSYENVCTGNTKHIESIKIIYNNLISYKELLKYFFSFHDFTHSKKTQYKSAIIYKNNYQKNEAKKIINILKKMNYQFK